MQVRRLIFLREKWLAYWSSASEQEQSTWKPFPWELADLFDRHKPGAKRGDGGKVKLSNYWTTPDGLRRTIFHEYGVQEESFSSPLNCLITEGGDYCTAHERDRVFGAKYDAYAHSKRGMSIYMNPEYELEDLHKALKWAVATSQEASPFCAVLVLPRYQMASYMRLFSHHNVTLIAKLRKHTFAFMPPDQWETELPDPGALPTAKFPVLIVEVANQLGREQYRSPGAHAAVQAASVAAGAVLVNAPDEAFTRSLSPYTVRPPKGFLRVLRRPRAPAPPGHFGARLTDCCLTEWHARWELAPVPPLQAEDMAVCGWERVVFTDGSKTEQGVGAGYVIPADASLDPAHMAILGPQTVNRAELTAQHAVLEDLVGGGSVALYTDSKFSIQKLMEWIADPGSLKGDPHADIVLDMGLRLAAWDAPLAIHKIKAHVNLLGNELADQAAKHAANHGDDPDVPARGVDSVWTGRTPPVLGESSITKPKTQLRPVVAKWLARTQGYLTGTHDRWVQVMHTIDLPPSQTPWRAGQPFSRAVVAAIFRTRNADHMCQHKLHINAKHKDTVDPRCPLGCRYFDTWIHTFLCPKSGADKLITTRHDLTCNVVADYISRGDHARWLVRVNAGRRDGEPLEPSIPRGWLGAGHEEGEPIPYNPDFVIVKGWGKHTPPPTGPVPSRWVHGDEGISVQIILGELKYTDDEKMAQKHVDAREKYAPLVQRLTDAGWSVQPEVATVVVGHRACVSLANRHSFRILGIDKKQHEQLQGKLAALAARWAASIIRHTRKFRARHAQQQTRQTRGAQQGGT